MTSHAVGNGKKAHAWADALFDAADLTIPDSPELTPHGRRLLATLGVRAKRKPDHLSAEARRWLTSHKGPATEATKAVRAALATVYADMRVVDGIVAWRSRNA